MEYTAISEVTAVEHPAADRASAYSLDKIIVDGNDADEMYRTASLTVIFIFICVGIFMRYTKYGREIYAIGGARKEALTAGIPLRRPMVIAFALSGFCAGFAGTVIGLKSGTAQGLGLQYLLLVLMVIKVLLNL